MLLIVLTSLLLTLLPAASSPAALESECVSPPDFKPQQVWGKLVLPDGPGPHPAVIILHGAGGWRDVYPRLARTLADSGFAALALDYYHDTGGAPTGSEEKLKKWPLWQNAVQAAVRFLHTQPSVAGQKIGLLGYSRGAFLAVSVAGSSPDIHAVVDYFGGGGGGTSPVEEEIKGMPPLLILHGEDDSIVPVSFAHRLHDLMIENDRFVEMHIYPGAGHTFNLTDLPTYDEKASSDAFSHTIQFLRERLIDLKGDNRSFQNGSQ